jgi:hypothetical protein
MRVKILVWYFIILSFVFSALLYGVDNYFQLMKFIVWFIGLIIINVLMVLLRFKLDEC